MIPKSPHRRNRLAPRCRLILSWVSRKTQGYVCSTFKKVRELGLERRETVWSLSTTRVKKLEISCASMRRMHLLVPLLIILLAGIVNKVISR
jgi:sugar phosphate permease